MLLRPRSACSPRRDGGATGIEYAALLLLVAALIAALLASGLYGVVARETPKAICKLFLLHPCEPPPLTGPDGRPTPTTAPTTHAPTPGTTGPPVFPGPDDSAGPTSSPSPSPSTSPAPTSPVNPFGRPAPVCVVGGDGAYGELTITFPVRYVDIRGGARVYYTKSKIVDADGAERWVVTVAAFVEASAATPSLPGNQATTDDPLGVDTSGLPFSPSGGAWIGANAVGTQTYSFTSQQEADAFPGTYAATRIKQVVGPAIEYNPLTGPLTRIPWLGDKIKGLFDHEPLKDADSWSVEAGLTGGLNGTFKADLWGVKAAISGLGRGWHLAGVSRNRAGDWTFNLRDRGLVDVSLVVDLGTVLKRQKAKSGDPTVDGFLDMLEKVGVQKYGSGFALPQKLRDNLTKNWPDVGGTVEFIVQSDYQLTVDKDGNPLRYHHAMHTSWTLRGRIADEVKTKSGKVKVPGTFQVPLDGGRQVTSAALDLRDPQNAAAAQNFFVRAGLAYVNGPTKLAEASPEFTMLDHLIRTRGTQTKLTYDELTGGGNLGVLAERKARNLLFRVESESTKISLTKSEIWEEGSGWVPWTACHR